MQSDEKTVSVVGSWSAVIIAFNQGVTFPGLFSFTSDGIVLANEPPSPFESNGHGSWIQTGPSSIAYTFLGLWGSAEGRLSASAKLIGALEYDSNKDGWNGPFKIEIYDADGTSTMSEHGTIACTRIAVESLD